MTRIARSLASLALVAAALTCPSRARAQPFSTPVGCDDCISFWYYLDHGGVTDYSCGSATYADHNGSDYSLRGGNDAIDDGNEVLAAARGVVTEVSDGNFDRCTACGGSGCGLNTPGGGFSNYVVIDHGSHDTTYGHMRSGSITVELGDTVECGTVIGHIGSAGCSTGAHLHFQPRPAGGSYTVNPLDPYEGDCSPTEASLWAEQGPHRGLPGFTCDDVPEVVQCPEDSYAIWTCTPEGDARRRCVDGVDSSEACAWGCTVMPTGSDDVCAMPPDDDDDGARADTDCDDSRGDVHPGAPEICGDDIDQDCSGSDEECEPVATGGATSTGASVSTGSLSPSSGTPASTTGTTGAGGSVSATTDGSLGVTTVAGASANGSTGVTGAPPLGTDGAMTDNGPVPPRAVESGCACRLDRAPPGSLHGLPLALLLTIVLTRRTRTGDDGRTRQQ